MMMLSNLCCRRQFRYCLTYNLFAYSGGNSSSAANTQASTCHQNITTCNYPKCKIVQGSETVLGVIWISTWRVVTVNPHVSWNENGLEDFVNYFVWLLLRLKQGLQQQVKEGTHYWSVHERKLNYPTSLYPHGQGGKLKQYSQQVKRRYITGS